MLARIMEVALIVNPFASEVSEERVRAVEQELGRVASVTTVLTERPRHASELAASSSAADAIVVFSGDGGFNEVLNGVAGEAPLGFLPGGGTSVLPRALGLPRDPARAAAQVAGAVAADLDRPRQRPAVLVLGRDRPRRGAGSARRRARTQARRAPPR
jgi:diacylglycerol kinase family enzyme